MTVKRPKHIGEHNVIIIQLNPCSAFCWFLYDMDLINALKTELCIKIIICFVNVTASAPSLPYRLQFSH